jgi:hypothetical protein
MEKRVWNKYIPIFFKGKPFCGKASFVNGYNGYTSTESDGCLCALIADKRGILSCWDENGNMNSITTESGVPIKLKNRRGISTELNGVLHVDYEDAYANGYYNFEEFEKLYA